MNQPNIEKTDLKTSFLESFADFELKQSPKLNTPLHRTRKKALESFEQLGFPGQKHEEWKYTNLKSILQTDFYLEESSDIPAEEIKSFLLQEIEANVIVLVNGTYRKDLSRLISPESELMVRNFGEAIDTHPELVDNYFAKYVNYQEEAFSALNTAFANYGLFIRVPGNKIVQHPVLIYHLTDARRVQHAFQPRNLYLIGKSSEISFFEKYDSIGEYKTFQNAVTEVVVHENAKVTHYKLQNEHPQNNFIGTTQVLQEKNSLYSNLTVTLNGGLVRNNLNVLLDGENVETHMLGLFMITGNTLADNHTIADHKKPNSMSNELYKGILDEKASGVFNGKIFVRPDAQKTNAYQQNRNVLLSENASINTKPQLEIWADDVKCSHGATTGSLDQQALFYLRARGIPEKQARALLVHAFAYEIIEKIEIPLIRDWINQLVEERLKSL